MTAKLAGPSGLVWVTRLSDGQPQAGAAITIRDAKGKVRWHGTTDADGVAITPGSAQLLPHKAATPSPPVAVGNEEDGEDGEDEGDGRGGDFTGPRAAELLVFARVGNDLTWVNPSRAGGLAAWNFHVTADAAPRAEQLRGFLHSDRGLYRPGDTVHLRGLARTMRLGGALRVPAARKVAVTVRDPRGEELLAKKVSLSPYGGFSFDVPTGEGARLGDYLVTARLGDGQFTERFSVEQYRTAAFEVKVPLPAREPIAGESVQLTAEARYLYGASLRGGSLTWRVYRRNRAVAFPKLAAFDFGDARTWYDDYVSRSSMSETLVREDEQKLDKNGRGRMTLKLDKDDFRAAQDLMVTAEVQDETHQTIAANVAIPAHPAAGLLRHRSRQPDRRLGGRPDDQDRGGRPQGGADRGERDVADPEARLELCLGGLGLPRQLPLREEGAGGVAAGDRHRPRRCGRGPLRPPLVGRVLPHRRGERRRGKRHRQRQRALDLGGGRGLLAGRGQRAVSTSSPTNPSIRSARPPSCC